MKPDYAPWWRGDSLRLLGGRGGRPHMSTRANMNTWNLDLLLLAPGLAGVGCDPDFDV